MDISDTRKDFLIRMFQYMRKLLLKEVLYKDGRRKLSKSGPEAELYPIYSVSADTAVGKGIVRKAV